MKKKKSEFRTNNSRKSLGHPAYIYLEEDDSYRYIGLTHSPVTQRKRNILLHDNPNVKDKSNAYARPSPSKEKKKYFGKRKKWRLSKENRKIFKKIIRGEK